MDRRSGSGQLDKAITGCTADDVEEIRSLGTTLSSWRSEILAHHQSGASNGPTEGLNLCVKRVKRCGHRFKRFEHYRLRILLTPAASAGQVDRDLPASELVLPTDTRRAFKAA